MIPSVTCMSCGTELRSRIDEMWLPSLDKQPHDAPCGLEARHAVVRHRAAYEAP